MNATAYAFFGLTILVAVIVAVLVFAVLRFAAAARSARRTLGDGRGDSLLLASALEDAFGKLKAQERATAARAEASERLNAQIIESLASGLLVVDERRQVQILNPAARRILRLDDSPLPDGKVLEAVPALGAVVDEALAGSAPVMRRQAAITSGDTTMHLGVTVSPLSGKDGTRGVICLFSDLTAVVALEEQLRLKEALARLGELTAGLAHEFRNGLATIHGYGRLLDPEALPSPQRQYVEGIRSETQALGEVVTNFLNFAKPAPLSCVATDLRALLERAAEDAPSARVTFDGDFGTVEADEVLLRQAFSNLFRNSVEACTAAGRAPQIDVQAVRHDDGAVHVALRDNGPGIAGDALAQVFQPFFTTRAGGTGLGLAIAQKVIVSHNGRIVASNDPGGGAVFTVTLPDRVGGIVSKL